MALASSSLTAGGTLTSIASFRHSASTSAALTSSEGCADAESRLIRDESEESSEMTLPCGGGGRKGRVR